MDYEVIYTGGESRFHPGLAVDYMQFVAPEWHEDGSDLELYAETEAVYGFEDANYMDLKEEILRQASEAGINTNLLEFNYAADPDYPGEWTGEEDAE